MPTCVPMSDLKDTAAFARKVAAAGEPVIVTKNGYEKMVVVDAELWREYRHETPEETLIRMLEESERDIAAGNVQDAFEGLEELRKKHGL